MCKIGVFLAKQSLSEGKVNLFTQTTSKRRLEELKCKYQTTDRCNCYNTFTISAVKLKLCRFSYIFKTHTAKIKLLTSSFYHGKNSENFHPWDFFSLLFPSVYLHLNLFRKNVLRRGSCACFDFCKLLFTDFYAITILNFMGKERGGS